MVHTISRSRWVDTLRMNPAAGLRLLIESINNGELCSSLPWRAHSSYEVSAVRPGKMGQLWPLGAQIHSTVNLTGLVALTQCHSSWDAWCEITKACFCPWSCAGDDKSNLVFGSLEWRTDARYIELALTSLIGVTGCPCFGGKFLRNQGSEPVQGT